MDSLRLKNFKAYRDEFDELFESGHLPIGNNFLLYGDNGSGKSSIYEAIKIIFFRDKLEALIPDATTQEDKEIYERNFWKKYNNKITNSPFEIKINENDYKDFSVENYQVFMIQIDELCISNEIKFDNFLEKFDFDIADITQFCSDNYSEIETNINTILEDTFREKDIEITINKEDNYSLIIKDTRRNLESKNEIDKYFNEAKINLILLLLLFESIKKAQDSNKRRILVLDDFITSLDVANRTFLMQYIFDNFKDFQILIFTHNVYFYNLIMYLIKDIYSTDNNLKLDKWIFSNLYEINGTHKLHIKSPDNRVSKIRDSLNEGATPEDIGNKIRQRFEVLLYEFSKLFMIGAVEDSNNILTRIVYGQNLYFKNKKTAFDLIYELEEILDLDNPQNLKSRLKGKIQSYKQDGFHNIQDTVKKLKLYQKVTLHPLSHGTIGQSSFTMNDIEQSLDLLERFEIYLKDLIDNDVDGA